MSTELLLAISLAINVILGLLVYLKNPRGKLNIWLGVLVLAMSEWIVANYLANEQSSLTIFWNRASFIGPVFMALSAYVFSKYLTGLKKFGRTESLLAIGSCLAVVLCLSPFAITGIQPILVGSKVIGINPVRGAGYFPLILWIVGLALGTVYVLARGYKTSRGNVRAQVRFIFIGIALCAVLSILTNIILPLLTGQDAYANYAPLSTIALTSLFTYAIIKHRFLAIRAAVARSVAYTLLLVTLGILYGLVIFIGTSFSFFNTASRLDYDITYTLMGLVLSFTFQPLRRFFERITDTILYRERYDSQVVLNELSKIMASELDLNRILKKILLELCDSVHIQFGQMIVFNNDKVYRIEHYGPLPDRLMIVPELRQLDRSMLVADELSSGDRKRILESHGVRVSLMLKTREDFIGYLLLGDKLSGDIYSDQDIELLEIIGKELAVAIQNAKAYAEIQAFNLTLQARVDHATNRLRVANRHLKDLDRAKDEFISMASHQLRTPLTTVKGYLSMMLEGDVGKMPANQKEFVQYAFDASERMVNLISDLLNVSRLSAGRFLIQRKPTDMVQMIEDEVRQLQQHAKQKGIALIFDPPPEPLPPAEIDDNKTRQVVMNFIDNAIYYTQKGEVRVVLEQTGDHVRLEVRDSGIGVPEDAKKKLFSKFYRATNAQTVRPDGTGLGLYLAKRVVEDQDGTIIFNSVEGKGSTFGFELPFKPEPTKPAKKREEPSGRQHAHK